MARLSFGKRNTTATDVYSGNDNPKRRNTSNRKMQKRAARSDPSMSFGP